MKSEAKTPSGARATLSKMPPGGGEIYIDPRPDAPATEWEWVGPKDPYAHSRLREQYGELADIVVVREGRAEIRGAGGYLGDSRDLSVDELREEYGELRHVAWIKMGGV